MCASNNNNEYKIGKLGIVAKNFRALCQRLPKIFFSDACRKGVKYKKIDNRMIIVESRRIVDLTPTLKQT